MIEAVGHQYWSTYFRTLDRLLAPGGKVGIQAILMPHDRMLATRRTLHLDQQVHLPGRLPPSVAVIDEISRTHTSLRVAERLAFGQSLRRDAAALGRRRSGAASRRVRHLGFDAPSCGCGTSTSSTPARASRPATSTSSRSSWSARSNWRRAWYVADSSQRQGCWLWSRNGSRRHSDHHAAAHRGRDPARRLRHLAAARRGVLRGHADGARGRVPAPRHRDDVPQRGRGRSRDRRERRGARRAVRDHQVQPERRRPAGRSWSRASRRWDHHAHLWLVHAPPTTTYGSGRASWPRKPPGRRATSGSATPARPGGPRPRGHGRAARGEPDRVAPVPVRRPGRRRPRVARCGPRGVQRPGGRPLRDPVVTRIADEVGRTPAQVLVRWHVQHDFVVIPAPRRPSGCGPTPTSAASSSRPTRWPPSTVWAAADSMDAVTAAFDAMPRRVLPAR